MKSIIEVIESRILLEGGKRSRSRSVVIETFFQAKTHVTIDELAFVVWKDFPKIGVATVYRTLKLLARMGYAKELDFGDGSRRYESNLSAHHDHLVCTRCGMVIEFEDPEIEKLQELVTRRNGFMPKSHRLDIFGNCRLCAEEEVAGMKK